MDTTQTQLCFILGIWARFGIIYFLSNSALGNGHYIYIEASSPRRQGDKADLISQVLSAGKQYCMRLAISMYGTDIGSIDILLEVCSI